jgi:hypothetical protein
VKSRDFVQKSIKGTERVCGSLLAPLIDLLPVVRVQIPAGALSASFSDATQANANNEIRPRCREQKM